MKYEYKASKDLGELDALGAEGWQLVTTYMDKWLILMREKEVEVEHTPVAPPPAPAKKAARKRKRF